MLGPGDDMTTGSDQTAAAQGEFKRCNAGNATLAMRTVSPRFAGFAGSEAYAALVYIQDSYKTTTRIMESKKVFIGK